MSHELPPAPDWRGVNHLALVTPDMDATTRFYAGVLGMVGSWDGCGATTG
ncbi:MAG: VOC family protein, partial [Actinomycetota bacterium]